MTFVSLLLFAATGASGAATVTTLAPTRQIVERRAETGSRLVTNNPMPANAIDPQRALMMRRLTGQCVVERQGAVARRVVAASNEYGIDYAKLGIPSSRLDAALSIEACMKRAMSQGDGLVQWQADSNTLRSLLIESLYRNSFKTMPVRDWHNIAPVPVATVSTNGKSSGASASTMFGECIVQADFAGADKFIRSEPGSAAESNAVAAVTPSIAPCLQAGSKLSLRKAALRNILADALWRFANGTPAGTAAAIGGGK